ncbi:MAG: hypothetical protein ACYC0V_20345 [Armatimonadota bacterium]
MIAKKIADSAVPMSLGAALNPALTTVVVDRAKMGKIAVDRLMATEFGTNANPTGDKVSLFPTMLVRQSCGWKVTESPKDNEWQDNNECFSPD